MPKVLIAKIKERGVKGQHCYEYKNDVDFFDFRKLALFLSDLESYGGNIEKAFREFKRLKQTEFPW